MTQKSLVIGVAGVLLLAGGGCSAALPNETNSKPAQNDIVMPSTLASSTEQIAEGKINSIELSGKALGNKMVQFNWKLPEGAKDPSAFHLLRSQNENPTQPPAHWFTQAGKSRSAVWVKLQLGEQHFRICTWENNKCEIYSNDIVVNVK